jgi:hypothetical protein
VAVATGEVELEGKVLVLRRVRVTLHLRADPGHRATADHVHAIFADACPLYRSLKAAIEITTELVIAARAGTTRVARPLG